MTGAGPSDDMIPAARPLHAECSNIPDEITSHNTFRESIDASMEKTRGARYCHVVHQAGSPVGCDSSSEVSSEVSVVASEQISSDQSAKTPSVSELEYEEDETMSP